MSLRRKPRLAPLEQIDQIACEVVVGAVRTRVSVPFRDDPRALVRPRAVVLDQLEAFVQ
jgi:hypothetical protein